MCQSAVQNQLFHTALIGGLDSAVSDWLTRIANAGGAPPSVGTINAVNTFWLSCESAGLSPLIYNLCCFVPDNLIACITPLIRTNGYPSYHNPSSSGGTPATLFTPADVSVNGLQFHPNNPGVQYGTFLDTGESPSPDIGASNSAGLSVYIYNDPRSGVLGFDGSYTFNGGGIPGNSVGLDCAPNFQNHGVDYFDAFGGGFFGGTGRCMWNITVYNSFRCYNRINTAGNLTGQRFVFTSAGEDLEDTTIFNLNGDSAKPAPSPSLYIGLVNDDGSASGDAGNALRSFYAFHAGFTHAQALSFFNAVQTLRQSLGGGWR